MCPHLPLHVPGWYGVLFIRQGVYQEGVFRFQLAIPENYPDGDCPVGIFAERRLCTQRSAGWRSGENILAETEEAIYYPEKRGLAAIV